jgi:hypothetical protein
MTDQWSPGLGGAPAWARIALTGIAAQGNKSNTPQKRLEARLNMAVPSSYFLLFPG